MTIQTALLRTGQLPVVSKRTARLAGLIAFVAAALFGHVQPAAAWNCNIDVTFRNDGTTAQTFFPHWARTRMRVGLWVRLWPKQEPILLPPGQTLTLPYWAEECQLKDHRVFEFHIDPAACGPTAPSDAWWLTGGGSTRPLGFLQRSLPAAGETIKIRIPETGSSAQEVWATTARGTHRNNRYSYVVDIGNLAARCPSG